MRSFRLMPVMLWTALALSGCPRSTAEALDPLFEGECQAYSLYQSAGYFPYFTRIDILLVVDSASGFSGLPAELPGLIQDEIRKIVPPCEILAWHCGYWNEDGGFYPALDIHFGVITSNVGAGALAPDEDPLGDDGRLLFDEACMPPGQVFADGVFFNQWDEEAWQDFKAEMDCIFSAIPDDYAVSQPLEAMHRAVTVNRDGPNRGFFRNDSLVFLLFLSQRDDCSAADESLFDPAETDLGPVGLRCVNNPHLLRPVSHYAASLEELDQGRVGVGLITAVPDDPVCGEDFDAAACLELPEMQIEAAACAEPELQPFCLSESGCAFAPRRLVEFANTFEFPEEQVRLADLCGQGLDAAVSHAFLVIYPSVLHLNADNFCSYPTVPFDAVVDPESGRIAACRLPCNLLITQPDDGPCPAPLVDFMDHGSPLIKEERDGLRRRVCLVPALDYAPSASGTCEFLYTDVFPEYEYPHPLPGTGWFKTNQRACSSYLFFSWPFVPADGAEIELTCFFCSCGPDPCPVSNGPVHAFQIGRPCEPRVCVNEGFYIDEAFLDRCADETLMAYAPECGSGLCLHEFGSHYSCTRRCDRFSPTACPPGYECQPLDYSQRSPDVCLPEL